MLPSRPDEARGSADGRAACIRSYPGHMTANLRGLYAITPDDTDNQRLCALVAKALAGGIDALQFRVKGGSAAARLAQAQAVKRLTDAAGVPLIVNDDVALACAIDAQGVHIGRDDGDPAQARDRIGPDKWLGVSCYDDFRRAQAVIGIADHVGFGSVFASPTKPHAVRAPVTLFTQARELGLNSVAIGGIDRHNATLPIEAGAQAVAIITDIFADPDPAAAARMLREIVHAALSRQSDSVSRK